MRIMVIHSSRKADYPVLDLIKTAKDMGIEVKPIVLRRINVLIDDDLKITYRGENLLEYSGGVVRSFGFNINLYQHFRRVAVLKALENLGVVLMNPIDPLLISRNKLMTLIMLKKVGIAVPRTFTSEFLKEEYQAVVNFGVSVIKPLTGSRGYGITLIKDPDVGFNVLKTLALYGQYPLVQEYIENRGYDIRAFVVNGYVIAAMRRVAVSSWKTNIAQGAKGEPIPLSEDIERIAVKATEAIGLWYAGVDIIESNGKFYVLEVNGSPDWKELKAVTKVDPAREILNCLIDKVKR